MKDTFYFQHDYNARNDPKIQDLIIEHGVAGVGIFWCIIEALYEQDGKLPLRSCKSIAFVLHVECGVVESVVRDFGLFESDGTYFWSNSVLTRLTRRKEISERRKMAAEIRWRSSKDRNQSQSEKKEDVERKEVNKQIKRFRPPTLKEVNTYISDKGYSIEAERFIDFYASKGWMVGRNKMKDWKAAVRNWNSRHDEYARPNTSKNNKNANDEWEK
jgi:hypothetical protein bfra3_11661